MTQSASPTPRPGTLLSFLGRIAALIQVRAELFSLEAEEQKHALTHNLFLALLAVACLLLGLISALIFITLITPAPLRPLVLGLITLGLLLTAALTLWRLVLRMQSQPSPFIQTLSEVRKDLGALLSKD
jgi:uncharacterized membrane protein YqjE